MRSCFEMTIKEEIWIDRAHRVQGFYYMNYSGAQWDEYRQDEINLLLRRLLCPLRTSDGSSLHRRQSLPRL
ncbi:hypothetical protein L596_014158 [Steinernema carpocapsae]|uniref:Uncharacterized protein n=1 Tax=Steinernema carpocapsae TaxID=34508 RepID=A0A4U5NBW6_STECR|nr:hypothetical protein L596_014158 [Steinernema carpocapsae]